MRTYFFLSRRARYALIASGIALAGGAGWLAQAQVGGQRGIAAVAASRDIQVSDIEVDVRGDTGVEAREKAWKEAQVKAWEKLDGPNLSDSQIYGMVSAIVVQRERLGPKRYIATLGVIFDRQKANSYLGDDGMSRHSAPMLLLPVTMSGGTHLMYEQRNPWQRAWAEFQAGQSSVNYVRPSGAGGESLLLTYGQTNRRSRVWWRDILDSFGAADVLIPIASLRYSYPGGPIEGTFTARHGPDNEFLDSFTMRAESPEQLPAMLEQAVRRFDAVFQVALTDGTIRPDPTLNVKTGDLNPEIARLVELGRRLKAQDEALAQAASQPTEASGGAISAAPVATPPPEGSVALYTVQFQTPDASSFGSVLAAVRGTPGVRSTGVRSTAIGGTSVMTVSYSGSIAQLAEALRGQGFTVQQGATALLISR
ncbi:heavy-metal-associated domain-containing protein [Qipengyuania sp. 1XM1-15A]|uniref:heavy-metal-associated domain-containing protein n=1 Tax=Qipengyuania xiamenensis TaxID=2867237 RepID=UPI001C87B2DC|nr:heavy-metal-associated domain-containing protein [Qipengyuania xiamenensis]MBX7533325.1 heavy-metal-associated domain-containing protein [Qipengyuania xiamenensis]